jgi:hypothetical protein
MTESAIQRAIVTGLRQLLPHGWIVQSTANKPRSAVAGAIEKSMGAIKGWPDLAVYGPRWDGVPWCWFFEVKAAKGRTSEAQLQVHDRLIDLGFKVGVVRNLKDACSYGETWGWPLKGRVA